MMCTARRSQRRERGEEAQRTRKTCTIKRCARGVLDLIALLFKMMC
jgi:hypothetical protein